MGYVHLSESHVHFPGWVVACMSVSSPVAEETAQPAEEEKKEAKTEEESDFIKSLNEILGQLENGSKN